MTTSLAANGAIQEYHAKEPKEIFIQQCKNHQAQKPATSAALNQMTTSLAANGAIQEYHAKEAKEIFIQQCKYHQAPAKETFLQHC